MGKKFFFFFSVNTMNIIKPFEGILKALYARQGTNLMKFMFHHTCAWSLLTFLFLTSLGSPALMLKNVELLADTLESKFGTLVASPSNFLAS